MTEDEINPGTAGPAVPLPHGKRVIASLTVAVPSVRVRSPSHRAAIGLLRQAANGLQDTLD